MKGSKPKQQPMKVPSGKVAPAAARKVPLRDRRKGASKGK